MGASNPCSFWIAAVFINKLTLENKNFFSTMVTMVYKPLALRPLHKGCIFC